MSSLAFTLPCLPLALNNAFANNPGGHGRHLTEESSVFKAAVSAIVREVAAQVGWTYQSGDRLGVYCYLVPRDRRPWDVDGRGKLAIDAIATALDFNDTCIDDYHVQRILHPAYAGRSWIEIVTLAPTWWTETQATLEMLITGRCTVTIETERLSRVLLAEMERLAAKRAVRRTRKRVLKAHLKGEQHV